MSHSIAHQALTPLSAIRSFADTLSPRMVSNTTLALTQAAVDHIVLVDDTQMLAAMRWLWQEANQLVEPAGAASIAAIQAGKIDLQRYRKPVALICGGNAGAAPVFDTYAKAVIPS